MANCLRRGVEDLLYLNDMNMIWFKYDAEGSLLREGNKTYRYGYLDKVMAVTDGDTTRTFTYHADGQLASASCDGIGRAGAHPALSPLRGSLRSGDMRTPQRAMIIAV